MSDAKKAIDLNTRHYDKYSKVYSFTTENIKGYFEHLDFKDKKVLTVAASGDHALNSILLGCSQVATFDINKLAYYFSELKYVAIKILKYKEFMNYFMLGDESFSYSTFNKIKKYLNDDVCKFFEDLYKYFNHSGEKLRTSKIFNNSYDREELKKEYNIYLNENEYYKLQKKMPHKIGFIYSSFHQLNIDEKYDIILLSNISDYISNIFGANCLEKFRDFIANDLSENLNEKGIIVLGYIYDYRLGIEGRSEIDSDIKRGELFQDEYFEIIQFKSAIDKNRKDAIIIYRKD